MTDTERARVEEIKKRLAAAENARPGEWRIEALDGNTLLPERPTTVTLLHHAKADLEFLLGLVEGK